MIEIICSVLKKYVLYVNYVIYFLPITIAQKYKNLMLSRNFIQYFYGLKNASRFYHKYIYVIFFKHEYSNRYIVLKI